MNSLKENIGPRIAKFRKRLHPKVTQEGLAELVGVEKNTVYRWEKGLVYPEPGNLESIARALKVSLSELMGGLEKNSTPTVESLLQALTELQKEHNDLKKESEAMRAQLESRSMVKEPSVQYQIDPNVPDDIMESLQDVSSMNDVLWDAVRGAFRALQKHRNKKHKGAG